MDELHAPLRRLLSGEIKFRSRVNLGTSVAEQGGPWQSTTHMFHDISTLQQKKRTG